MFRLLGRSFNDVDSIRVAFLRLHPNGTGRFGQRLFDVLFALDAAII
jgi:hypothetical protein